MWQRICNYKVAYLSATRNSPNGNGSSPTDRAFTLLNGLPRSVLQVKRAGPEIDDPVMAPQDLRPEQSRHGLGTSEQIAVNEAFQIDHADIFAHDIHRA